LGVFYHWAFFTFGRFLPLGVFLPLDIILKIKGIAQMLGYFSHGSGYVLILTKKWVGRHFGGFFFRNSSGHPGASNARKLQASEAVSISFEIF
jgi:hypothetical protein